MDTAFICDKCGQHIVIDESGTGMTVRCPSCNDNLIVPAKGRAVKIPPITVNVAGAIETLAKAVDAGLLDDDTKLDAFLKHRSPRALEAVYGKDAARAYQSGDISARELQKSGPKLTLAEYNAILHELNE